MGNLYLVRHGQASFGAADYDQLSPRGMEQSERLGAYLVHKGLSFDTVLTGSLRRHAQTYAGMVRGATTAREATSDVTSNVARDATGRASMEPIARLWEGLNEYDGEAIIHAIHPAPLASPDTPELYRQHFHLLRDGLTQWMNGVISPLGMPSYTAFVQGVADALTWVCKECEGNVLMVTSGGPISTAVGQVLGTSPETTITLNYQIRNTALTEFSFNRKRHTLVTFNTLPHLDDPAYASWITHA